MIFLKKNIDTLSDDEYSSVLKSMPLSKQKEIQAYKKDDDKLRSVCGYMLAITALSEFLKKDRAEITLSYDDNGKPCCNGAFLSIAHAGKYAVCAVSDREIGVDVETSRRVSPKTAVCICTSDEMKYIFGENFDAGIPENITHETSMRFLEIWTKKEAYGKMLGTGILYDMKNTDVSHVKTWFDGELIISVCEKT